MDILILNPNTSAAMTAKLLAHARATQGVRARFEAIDAPVGVDVVASRATYAVAAQSTIEAWAAYDSHADAIVVACFGDPGVGALRELTSVPVYGLAETSMQALDQAGEPYAIVTSGSNWSPMLRALASSWGISERFLGTYAASTSGLQALHDPQAWHAAVQSQIEAANADGARAILLGGAVFAGMGPTFESRAALQDGFDLTIACALDGAPPTREPPTRAVPVRSRGLSAKLAASLQRETTS
jgi:Asp/Glu/hydantoin racemase